MRMKTVAKAGVLALLMSGCGGVVEEGAPESLDNTEQALIWDCSGDSTWTRRWYTDSSLTQEVGREDCECDGHVYTYGTTSGIYRQQLGYSCGGSGGGGGGGGGGGECRTANPNYVAPGC